MGPEAAARACLLSKPLREKRAPPAANPSFSTHACSYNRHRGWMYERQQRRAHERRKAEPVFAVHRQARLPGRDADVFCRAAAGARVHRRGYRAVRAGLSRRGDDRRVQPALCVCRRRLRAGAAPAGAAVPGRLHLRALLCDAPAVDVLEPAGGDARPAVPAVFGAGGHAAGVPCVRRGVAAARADQRGAVRVCGAGHAERAAHAARAGQPARALRCGAGEHQPFRSGFSCSR